MEIKVPSPEPTEDTPLNTLVGEDDPLAPVSGDLERCPRCGFGLKEIRWGQTNCPNCGLHFECC